IQISLRSLTCAASCRYAGRKRPRVKLTRVTFPDTGMRLTCTAIGERKMLICCHDPGGAAAATAGPATSTRPSAGARTASSPPEPDAFGRRSGSRKKKMKNAASARNGIASAHATAAAAAATTRAPTMKGTPAGSMRVRSAPRVRPCRERRGRLGLPVPPQDVLHAVLQLQLSFFQGDFFDLFGFREVMLGGELV